MDYKTPEFKERLIDLQTGHWSEAKKAADAIGLVKPEGIKWDDFAEEIAIAEFNAANSPVNVPDLPTSIEVNPDDILIEGLDEEELELAQELNEWVDEEGDGVVKTPVESEVIVSMSVEIQPNVGGVLADHFAEKIQKTIAQEAKSGGILKPASAAKPIVGSPLFSTEAYKAAGVSVCSVCGDKTRYNRHNKPVCSIARSDCPMLKLP